uniref:Uncharacterized protein n=1 Tax=Panagrolaimus superbus TaxID=310955 RepID=A0A914ZD72_9BILA
MGHGSSHHHNYAYDGSPDQPESNTYRSSIRRHGTNARSTLPPTGHVERPPVIANRRLRERTVNNGRNGTSQVVRVPQRNLIRDRQQSSAHPGNHPSGVTRPWKFDAILARTPPLDQETLEKFAWNPDDRSLNVFVKDDDRLTFHRHPVAQSTDCIRGKVGFSKGFHVWKITWPVRQRGTNAVIGVATKTAPMHLAGYHSLIGQNSESYGWDINRNRCGFDARHESLWKYPTAIPDDGRPFVAPDDIYCILDMDEGFMAFASRDQYYGVAFRGLKGKKLYPVVSCVWGHCEVTMKYLGGCDPEPRQLMEACRNTILGRLENGKDPADVVRLLPLPKSLKNFLLYKPN